MFDKYDPNGDNFLEKHEIRMMLRELARRRGRDPSREELDLYTERFMVKADVNRNGKIGRV